MKIPWWFRAEWQSGPAAAGGREGPAGTLLAGYSQAAQGVARPGRRVSGRRTPCTMRQPPAARLVVLV
ncbi:DUF6229 family protein [Zestomonas thermotolerans]|uniref:DUF6229 family protein n=1 Tax=Zestomonas thermotolerans TaxID=157784 RepID=UPI003B589CB2